MGILKPLLATPDHVISHVSSLAGEQTPECAMGVTCAQLHTLTLQLCEPYHCVQLGDPGSEIQK